MKITKKQFFDIRELCMNEVKHTCFVATKQDMKTYMLNEISFYFDTCAANILTDNEDDNERLSAQNLILTAE